MTIILCNIGKQYLHHKILKHYVLSDQERSEDEIEEVEEGDDIEGDVEREEENPRLGDDLINKMSVEDVLSWLDVPEYLALVPPEKKNKDGQLKRLGGGGGVNALARYRQILMVSYAV